MTARSQQAIINLPSADITPRKEYFFMHETQVRGWQPGRYWYGTNFFCYGVAKYTEFAVTSYNTGTPWSNDGNAGIGFKSAIPLAKESQPDADMKLTVGAMGTLNYRGQGIGTFDYTHFSFRLPELKTRITAGGFFATKQLVKRSTVNVLAAAEHPLLGNKLLLMAEWFAGRHDFGFFIPGVMYRPTKHQMVVVGYKIPNVLANGRHGLVIEWGIEWH